MKWGSEGSGEAVGGAQWFVDGAARASAQTGPDAKRPPVAPTALSTVRALARPSAAACQRAARCTAPSGRPTAQRATERAPAAWHTKRQRSACAVDRYLHYALASCGAGAAAIGARAAERARLAVVAGLGQSVDDEGKRFSFQRSRSRRAGPSMRLAVCEACV